MKLLLLVCGACVLLTGLHDRVVAQNLVLSKLKTQDWLSRITQIELLKASKIDVERMLGKPEVFDFPVADFIEYYRTPSGRVTVSFSASGCTTSGKKTVPTGVVEEIALAPSAVIRLSGLKLPLSEFRKKPEDDTPIIVYTSQKHGVEFSVLEGRVIEVKFFPSKRIKYFCEQDR